MYKRLTKIKPAKYVVAGLFALCFSSLSIADSPVLDRVVENGVLKVAMSADQPPFNYRSKENSVVGFDVDLAQGLADEMNVKLKIVEIPFGNLLTALTSGKVDAVISGMTITPERSQTVVFVGPYATTGKSMLTTARVKSAVKDGSVFNDTGIRVVALQNSTSESFVQRNLPKASLHTIANYDEGIQMLLTGEIDAMVADIPILKLSMLRNPEAGLGIIEPPLAMEPIGIAIPNNDKEFEGLVRDYLSAFENTEQGKGSNQKWFKDDSWITGLP